MLVRIKHLAGLPTEIFHFPSDAIACPPTIIIASRSALYLKDPRALPIELGLVGHRIKAHLRKYSYVSV